MRQIVIELLREQFSVVANNTDSLGVKHVTSHALASAGAIALSGPALAAEPLPPPPPPPPFSWTGLFAGLQVGFAWDRDPVTATSFDPPTAAPPPAPPPTPVPTVAAPATAPADPPGFPFVRSLSENPSGVIGGAHLGYNLQINQWVLGFEGSVDGTSIHSDLFGLFGFTSITGVSNLPIFASADTRSDIQGSIRLRAGIAFDRVLLYATGGAAFAGITTVYTSGSPFFLTESDSKTRSGWTVGGGLAYALTDNSSIRAEYRYSDFGHTVDYPFAVLISPFSIFSVQHHLTQNQVQFGITHRFD